jgi:hypothetical protein
MILVNLPLMMITIPHSKDFEMTCLDGPAATDTPPFEASNAAAAVAVTSQDEGRVALSKTTLIFLNVFSNWHPKGWYHCIFDQTDGYQRGKYLYAKQTEHCNLSDL